MHCCLGVCRIPSRTGRRAGQDGVGRCALGGFWEWLSAVRRGGGCDTCVYEAASSVCWRDAAAAALVIPGRGVAGSGGPGGLLRRSCAGNKLDLLMGSAEMIFVGIE